jgi:hypothetical protein
VCGGACALDGTRTDEAVLGEEGLDPLLARVRVDVRHVRAPVDDAREARLVLDLVQRRWNPIFVITTRQLVVSLRPKHFEMRFRYN